jgi:hypothetical protein
LGIRGLAKNISQIRIQGLKSTVFGSRIRKTTTFLKGAFVIGDEIGLLEKKKNVITNIMPDWSVVTFGRSIPALDPISLKVSDPGPQHCPKMRGMM